MLIWEDRLAVLRDDCAYSALGWKACCVRRSYRREIYQCVPPTLLLLLHTLTHPLPTSVVRAIEHTPTLSGDLPLHECKILSAGELAPGEDDGTDIFRDIKTLGDKYEDFPDDEDKADIGSVEVVVQAAKEIREGGNALFKAGKYADALDQYKSAFLPAVIFRDMALLTRRMCAESLRYLDVHPVLPDNTPDTVRSAYLAQLTPLLLNMSLAALKITPIPTPNTHATEVVRQTTRVLSLSPSPSSTDQGKALYRRALANVQLQEEDGAEADLVQALVLVPGDEAIRNELEKVRGRKKEKRDKQKKAYKGLFSSS